MSVSRRTTAARPFPTVDLMTVDTAAAVGETAPPPWPPPAGEPVAPPTRRRFRAFRLAVVAAAIVGALLVDATAALLVPFLFVAVVPFEKLFPRHRQRLRRHGVGTDIAYGLTQPLLVPLGVAVGIVVGVLSLAWLPGLALSPLVAALPPTLRTFSGVVLFDVVFYWAHRWSHEVPFLWRFHAVHHSTKHLDWVSGLRNHPFDGALVAPPFVFLLAAGFGVELAGVLAVIQIVLGLFLHANVRWRWRPLDRILVTPEFHHWHHADERDAHNSNYSVFLPLWDLLFGTYFLPADRRPAVYGVTPALPDGIIEQLRHPFRGLHSVRWMVRHPLAELRHLVRAVPRGLRQVAATSRRRHVSPGPPDGAPS